jgi:hypothetical protein
LIGDVLEWVAHEGFGEFFSRIGDFSFGSTKEYQQRYLLQALKGMVSVR